MADSLPPNAPRTVTHYRLIRPLGAGGMGSVFEGEDRRDRSRVAIKLLHAHLAEDPSFRERFEREAHTAALLRSPYTVHLLDYGQASGHFFLVMEYIDGVSLSSLIAEQPLSPGRAVRIAAEVARALEEADARGVVHRDVKPENILIDSDQGVKVADFGIARRRGGGNLTELGGFVGSVLFASPEQARGDADHRSDIYAVGVVLYAMLAGHPPFNGSTFDVLRQHAEASFPVAPLQGMPDAVVNIVRRCMEKDPQDRYQSASELAGALERATRSVQLWEQRRTAEAEAPPPESLQRQPATNAPPPTAAAPPLSATAPPGLILGPAQTDGDDGETNAAEPDRSDAATVVGPSPLSPQPTVAGADAPLVGLLRDARPPQVAEPGEPAHPEAPPPRVPSQVRGAPASGLRGALRPTGSRSSSKLVLGMAVAVLVLAAVGVGAWLLWPGPKDESITGTALVAALDDLGPDSFSSSGSASARTVRPSLSASNGGAIDSVRLTSTVDGVTRLVEFVVFPSAASARAYAGEVAEQAGTTSVLPCVTEQGLPDALLVGLTSTCYQRDGDVVIIASVAPPAGNEEARGLLQRAGEVLDAIRDGEKPRRATPVVERTPPASVTAAPSRSPSPSASPSGTPTTAPPPMPTVVPIPISSGVWNYDFGVTINTCSFGPAVGERVVAAFRLDEIVASDDLISPGELVDVTQEATQFYVGRFTFTFPTFEFSYPVLAANQTGTARVTNTYSDAVTGLATLLETYALAPGATCTFFGTE